MLTLHRLAKAAKWAFFIFLIAVALIAAAIFYVIFGGCSPSHTVISAEVTRIINQINASPNLLKINGLSETYLGTTVTGVSIDRKAADYEITVELNSGSQINLQLWPEARFCLFADKLPASSLWTDENLPNRQLTLSEESR